MKQQIMKMGFALLVASLCLAGCGHEEIDNLLNGAGDSNDQGEPVEFSISLQGNTEYNQPASNPTRSTDANAYLPDTRSERALIGEWVKVNSFSATRSAEEYEGPAMAAMDLTEDEPATTAPGTRGVMTTGYYFRVIAFKKVGSNYVYQAAADYTANGTNAPVLKQGRMNIPIGQTYRFVAYSFNNATAMGTFPTSYYTWNSTAISISDLSNDFMTFDSEDKTVTGATFNLPISFTQQLCKLTVKISVTGFGSNNTFTSCTGVYVTQGGNASSWVVGQAAVAANTDNTAPFNIANGSTTTFTRLVPFAGSRAITVHFTTLTVGGKAANNTNITSSKSVQLQPGKSYTMTVQFKKMMGTQVPEGDIDLGGTDCTTADKKALSKIIWADGNVMGTNGAATDYTWATMTGYGHYYTWNSYYMGNGSTSNNNGDVCGHLDVDTYGTGWKTPNNATLEQMSRCTNKQLTNSGMMFLNTSNTKGIFLPAAGNRNLYEGSGTSAPGNVGSHGYYWSSVSSGSSNGNYLYFFTGRAYLSSHTRAYGHSVRCVKG